tara:strand:+ start:2595 stop:2831 length:237 start_codon:yes stop_codon:yes gene_type:complete
MTQQERTIAALKSESENLNSQLMIAVGHAEDGDPRAQAEVVNLLTRLDDIEIELEDWQSHLADMDHMTRHEPDWFDHN